MALHCKNRTKCYKCGLNLEMKGINVCVYDQARNSSSEKFMQQDTSYFFLNKVLSFIHLNLD